MEQFARILDNVIRNPSPEFNYGDILQDVLNFMDSGLAQLTGVGEDEIAILLVDQRRNLKFYRPKYLAHSGVIPTTYARSLVTKVYQTGAGSIDNRFQATPHLGVFEGIKKNNPNVSQIHKIMCLPLRTSKGIIFGAVEISRKGATPEAAGADWSHMDLERVNAALAPNLDNLHQLCHQAGIL